MSHRRFAFMFFLGPQKALTFLEVIIALTLNAVAFLGLFQIFNVALNINHRSTQELIATNLGRAMVSEIMTRVFVDPQEPLVLTLGPNTITGGDSATDHKTWDDVDDYTGYSEAPPKTLLGAAMNGAGGTPDYSDFSRSVSVVYCQVQSTPPSIVPSTGSGTTPTNMKMITVTVSGPDFNPVSIVEVLSNIP